LVLNKENTVSSSSFCTINYRINVEKWSINANIFFFAIIYKLGSVIFSIQSIFLKWNISKKKLILFLIIQIIWKDYQILIKVNFKVFLFLLNYFFFYSKKKWLKLLNDLEPINISLLDKTIHMNLKVFIILNYLFKAVFTLEHIRKKYSFCAFVFLWCLFAWHWNLSYSTDSTSPYN
jgi:hypothetical protein